MENGISRYLFFKLFTGFIIFIILLTVCHEAGHYIVSAGYGNKQVLHYNSITYESSDKMRPYSDSLLYLNDLPESTQDRLRKKIRQYYKEEFHIRAGGPLFNILIGTLGFIIMFLMSDKSGFDRKKWWIMFLILFWIRQLLVFPLTLWVYFIEHGNLNGDEEFVSAYFSWPFYSIGLFLFISGILMITIPMFRFFTFRERSVWLLSAFFGGIIGCLLWFYILGPYFLS